MAWKPFARYKQGVAIPDFISSGENRGQPWLRKELVAPWWEIVLVIAVVIGISALKSTWSAFHGSSAHYVDMLLTDQRMIHYVAIESGLLALLFFFLHGRGWTRADLKIRPGWWRTLLGLPLALAMMLSNFIVVASGFSLAYALQTKFGHFLPFLATQVQAPAPHSVHFHWTILIAAMILNAFFEEITCMGYTFTQFAAKRGPLFALVVTVLLRMSCHTYEGLLHVLGIGVVFLLTGLFYWRTRKLWALIVAHALVDIISFALVKFVAG